MTKTQGYLISLALFVIFALYFLADTKPPKNKSEGNSETVDVFDFKEYIGVTLVKLQPKIAEKLSVYDSIWKNTQIDSIKQEAFGNLVTVLYKNGNLALAAHYGEQKAEKNKSLETFEKAGDMYTTAFMREKENQALRKHLIQKAISNYGIALEMDSNNVDVRVKLASTYLDGEVDIMKGVKMLRDIVDNNEPNNITANLILGRYGLISGQYKKAVKRLETVLMTDSTNAEAYYFMAEAYNGLGDKQKAIELFEKCKTLINNPSFSSEIDEYIKRIRNF